MTDAFRRKSLASGEQNVWGKSGEGDAGADAPHTSPAAPHSSSQTETAAPQGEGPLLVGMSGGKVGGRNRNRVSQSTNRNLPASNQYMPINSLPGELFWCCVRPRMPQGRGAAKQMVLASFQWVDVAQVYTYEGLTFAM